MTLRFRAPLLAALLLAAPALVHAQADTAGAPRDVALPPRPRMMGLVDSATFAAIRREGLERSQVLALATGLSDLQPPRLAGSPGFLEAARWARDWLTAHGISARLEPWGRATASWVVDRYSVELVSPFYARLTAFPRAWSPATNGTVRGRVFVGSLRAESDTLTLKGKLRGRIFLNGTIEPFREREEPPFRRWSEQQLDSLARLTEPGEPATPAEDYDPWAASMVSRRRLAAFLAREGALAVIEPSGNPTTLGASGWWNYPAPGWGGVPSFTVMRPEFNRLIRLVEAGKPVRIALSLAARRVRPDSLGYNVIGELPGTDPAKKDEVVLMGGHLDSWLAGSGATDNAAGCAVVMEALRILTALDVKPRRTIRLGLWDAEETSDDYAGASGYARRHLGDPRGTTRLPGHARFSAYFNVDNGSGRIRGLWMQGNSAARPLFDRLLAPFADLGATHTTIAHTGSTDHIPFWSLGLPAFQFIQDPLDYESRTHHTALDGADYLIETDLKQAAVVLAGLVLQVAQMEDLVPRGGQP